MDTVNSRKRHNIEKSGVVGPAGRQKTGRRSNVETLKRHHANE